ncbi:hypothetical protein NDU88_001091 [Pleurodeles waltl]|uniref:Uncharacterized protein n=1 Tax=Pleurodeles waltl TaxID=8319 RepID=A0AAV7SZ12_PLEWA|nr:hypothetical protein NDU88_001091 [Pleurodeles waltl]
MIEAGPRCSGRLVSEGGGVHFSNRGAARVLPVHSSARVAMRSSAPLGSGCNVAVPVAFLFPFRVVHRLQCDLTATREYRARSSPLDFRILRGSDLSLISCAVCESGVPLGSGDFPLIWQRTEINVSNCFPWLAALSQQCRAGSAIGSEDTVTVWFYRFLLLKKAGLWISVFLLQRLVFLHVLAPVELRLWCSGLQIG